MQNTVEHLSLQSVDVYYDCTQSIRIMHSGTIENRESLHRALTLSGHTFRSRTDSELIAHLFEEAVSKANTLQYAFERTVEQLTGTHAIAARYKNHPNSLLIARIGNPIIYRVNDSCSLDYTDDSIEQCMNHIHRLNEGERALLTHGQKPIIWTQSALTI